ncbi:MAG: ABC-2 transporter permease [Candidatus Methanomethylophilaceae archaeon]|nr:ABC-2 transporter permease [Candidatus Methanomethylophilaceae archaeon]MBR3475569.1 ABC-2 transporter permease [Candidatus Methanomethylophilaceae archaeon]MBR4243845.1 ABC-2 transporter permease [Candidatus Methanomethylophilaceae archaeon]MBR6870556.1 ABC-2 transporter permease [Candidatus Methanomethylophilaceae archaeon]
MMEEGSLDERRTMGDEDVLRYKRYSPPPASKQVLICFMNQLSLFSKERSVWALLLLLPAMPALYLVFDAASLPVFPDTAVADIYAAYVLAALPLVSILLSSVICGSMLPIEFSERTAYLTMPLPVSRRTLFFGKFFAGFFVCALIVCGAYGIAGAISMMHTTQSYTPQFLISLAVSLSGVFFYCSFAYMLSTRMSRGSSIAPLVLMAVAIPLICILAAIAVPPMSGILGYIPVFSTDLSLDILGCEEHLSLYGAFQTRLVMSLDGFKAGPDSALSTISSMVLGALMLFIGCRMNDRRDV